MVANRKSVRVKILKAFLIGAAIFTVIQVPAHIPVVSQAEAAPLQINFSGSIGAGSFLDPTGQFSQGDSISGFWVLDTATVDTDPDPTRGSYAQTGSPVFQINIGSNVFTDDAMTIQILDNHTLGIGTIDAYDVLGGGGATSNIAGFTALGMQITLRDTQAPLDALTSDALPSFAPDPAMFDQFGQAQGQIFGTFNGSQFFMNLQISQTSIAGAIPEPATLALFGFGLIGLGFVRRRRLA